MKKSAKNCTLYHVVYKSAWADIGAANQLAPVKHGPNIKKYTKPLKVGTNENGSACGRWLSIGI